MSVGEEIGKSLNRIALLLGEKSSSPDQGVNLQTTELRQELQEIKRNIGDLSDRVSLLELSKSPDEENDKKLRRRIPGWLRVPRIDPQATGLLLLSCVFMFVTAVGIGWLIRTLL
mgnify:CR=1 FL=1